MRITFSLLIILFVTAVACNKDKFTTIPQVKINSISPETVSHGNILIMKGEFTDKEGDLDSVLIVYKWYNGAAVTFKDTFRYTFTTFLPSVTKRGDIEVAFQYNTANPNGYLTLPGVSKDTTATFGLIISDKEKNRSTYAESQPIRLKKP
jgi:hypothetical protein